MTRKTPEKILSATPEDIEKAHAIVAEELGAGFFLDYTTLPKNVGVMGDERVVGHTVLLSCELGDPTKFLCENDELLTRVVGRICNETGGTCRVLFDITPGGGEFSAD